MSKPHGFSCRELEDKSFRDTYFVLEGQSGRQAGLRGIFVVASGTCHLQPRPLGSQNRGYCSTRDRVGTVERRDIDRSLCFSECLLNSVIVP